MSEIDPAAVLTGSCLCGAVAFEVDGPVAGVGQCHCSLCRKVSGTASNAVFIVGKRRFRGRAASNCSNASYCATTGAPPAAPRAAVRCRRVTTGSESGFRPD